ncbi:diguanylate cyclase [Paracoccus sp. PARArs4]|uniref:diguanylate cyclase n=1 Tax=Paracoccus sp. PARArs4 TaxID=2853442 RepID=UPI0024A72C49|nr:diguanylate cyclase [Paracoccus sp. PARArs4]
MTARILVADGSATARITLKVRLGSACHGVATAGTSAEVLGLLSRGSVDLLILNGPLADMSAAAACQLLRRTPATATTSIVVMVTGRERLAALCAGATATLDPAVEDEILLAQIRRLLSESQQEGPVGFGMAELRARPNSCDASYAIVTDAGSRNSHAIALDLGAGEVLADPFADAGAADASAIALDGLLARKSRKDRKRAETQRQLEEAIKDPLTGLFNRRYAEPRMLQIARNAAQSGTGFAILALDLDHFKSINDQLGHAAGDAVLAEGIRAAICGQPVRIGGTRQIGVSASIGVSHAHPHAAQDAAGVVTGVMQRADLALMAAKKAGRNRVIASHPERAA